MKGGSGALSGALEEARVEGECNGQDAIVELLFVILLILATRCSIRIEGHMGESAIDTLGICHRDTVAWQNPREGQGEIARDIEALTNHDQRRL